MKSPRLTGLLIRARPGTSLGFGADKIGSFSAAGVKFELEPLFQVPGQPPELGLQVGEPWFLAQTAGSLQGAVPWDVIHAEVAARATQLGLGAEAEAIFIEPDLEQQFLAFPPQPEEFAAKGKPGQPDPQDPDFPVGPGFAWFLRDQYSQLGKARQQVGATGEPVRIAHIDTGYDPQHSSVPENLRPEFGFDFVDADRTPNDPGASGALENPGHGTGTLSILAGNQVDELQDYLGGAPLAEIIPTRIATSVVLLRTSALARALLYVLAPNNQAGQQLPAVDVVSLSMGGVASQAWAKAVNDAYEAGVTIVAAAGNNFSAGLFGVPTRFIVYPARFRRVIAACGVMANRRPYYGLPIGKMQGNFGPPSKMATAMAAYTPNMPWAEMGAPKVVDMNGAGTSSATPQIAAAAALWIQKHRAALKNYSAPWMRVEAVRHSLFTSADKTAGSGSPEKLGNGILRAADALAVQPPANVAYTPPDSAWFPLLRVLTGLGIQAESGQAAMFALEATQLAQQWDRPDKPNLFEEILPDPDLPASGIPRAQVQRFLDALIQHPRASQALRAHLKRVYGEIAPTPPSPPASPTVMTKPAAVPPGPPQRPVAVETALGIPVVEAPKPIYRRLRGYAFDPSLKQQLETAPISELTFKVPWEELEPGPVGEYLEVVDYDPASKCFYSPVNLDDPYLLAQDGLAPSEGTPQFHQQMVYAVAGLTIRNFERALGRKALWAPGPSPDPKNPDDDSHYVQRLRIYPHALREANAYYSPNKKALLFGYYPASADDPGGHLPGGMVFTCLSHDVIAHETAHALLDGMHRRFTLPTNADMRAFHEAFADIVAMFQHFTFPEILLYQIAETRGEIRWQENLLGQLATQFGRTTGMRGALRDAIGRYNKETGKWEPHKPDPKEYEQTEEPHARGAILVSAVFDAFLSIYETRIADLLRLATGGTGVLPAGAIHPDLVNRLSEETAKAANHVLAMCIRALDYCPPVDLTFGEYLRALITADYDLVRDDDLNYRVAFIEAFRRRGIYPRDVRTLSVESLLWRSPHNPHQDEPPSEQFLSSIQELRDFVQKQLYAKSRSEIFKRERRMRRDIHEWLERHFASGTTGAQDAAYLGLEADRKFEVHSARLVNRIGPDGDLLPQLVIEVLQKKESESPVPFMGGSTIIAVVADLQNLKITYCIRKDVRSETRAERQREFVQKFADGTLRATYFAETEFAASREPFALLHRT